MNNSVIAQSEIGEGGGSLICLTDNMDCCKDTSNFGYWIDSDNDTISKDISNGIYQELRANLILLQRQEMASNHQFNGIFRCDIVDANNQMQHLYVGIYTHSDISE